MAERDSGQPEFAGAAQQLGATSFLQRAVIRRRVRFLRRRRELALYDLGGFMFESHRLGEPREELVAEKLAALSALDDELAMLQSALDLREELAVLHEPGIAACPACGTLHDSAANFCPHCGLAVGAQAHVEPADGETAQMAVAEPSPPEQPVAGAEATAQLAATGSSPPAGAPMTMAGSEATAQLAVADPSPPEGEPMPVASSEATAQMAVADPSPPDGEPDPEASAQMAAADSAPSGAPEAPGEPSAAAADAPS